MHPVLSTDKNVPVWENLIGNCARSHTRKIGHSSHSSSIEFKGLLLGLGLFKEEVYKIGHQCFSIFLIGSKR